MTVIILASSFAEGARFGSNAGIRGPRVVAGSDSAAGLRGDIILELESYSRRRDRHQIESHLARSHSAAFVAPPIRMLIPDEQVQALRPAAAVEPHQTTLDEQISLADKDRLRGAQAKDQAATPQVPAFKPRSRAKKRG